jgi:hypothetical protein
MNTSDFYNIYIYEFDIQLVINLQNSQCAKCGSKIIDASRTRFDLDTITTARWACAALGIEHEDNVMGNNEVMEKQTDWNDIRYLNSL